MRDREVERFAQKAASGITSVLFFAALWWFAGKCKSSDPPAPTQGVMANGQTVAWTGIETSQLQPTPKPVEPIQIDVKPQGPTLPGVSLKSVAEAFHEIGFVFEPSNAPGTPQAMGRHANGSWIQLKGWGDAVERVGLCFMLIAGEDDRTIHATLGVLTLMNLTGWPEGRDWAIQAIGKHGGKKVRGTVQYEVVMAVPGLFVLEASPVALAAPAAKAKEPKGAKVGSSEGAPTVLPARPYGQRAHQPAAAATSGPEKSQLIQRELP